MKILTVGWDIRYARSVNKDSRNILFNDILKDRRTWTNLSLHEGKTKLHRLIYVVNGIVGIRRPTKHIKTHKELTVQGHKLLYVCMYNKYLFNMVQIINNWNYEVIKKYGVKTIYIMSELKMVVKNHYLFFSFRFPSLGFFLYRVNSASVHRALIIRRTSAMLAPLSNSGNQGSCQKSGGQGPLRKASWQLLNHHPPPWRVTQWPLYRSLSWSRALNFIPRRSVLEDPVLIMLSPETLHIAVNPLKLECKMNLSYKMDG